ncbi:MAG: energy transducer TonB [Candidatus Acidiferrales bacterium]
MIDDPERTQESRPVSAPVKDRRLHPRQRVRSLSYVELGEGNGGIVLNISEGGIAVQAAEVLDVGDSRIAMRIEVPRSRRRLEVSGEIVWIGKSRKEVGLRFVDLQEEALRRIRSWMAREASPETAVEESEAEAEVEAPVRAHAAETAEASGGEVAAQEEEVAVQAEESSAEDEEPAGEVDELVAEDDESAELAEAADEGFEDDDADDEAEAEGKLEAKTEDKIPEPRYEPGRQSEAPVLEAAEPLQPAPAVREAKPPLPPIAPPAVAFERKTQIPISPLNAISGAHGAPSFGVTAAPPVGLGHSSAGDAGSTLFPRPHVPTEAKAPDDGGRSFRVQLQSGWFLALLILLLAAISFIAGMAVRRGALNGMMDDIDDVAQPKSAPAPTPGTLATIPAANASGGAAPALPAKPLQIEIVDSGNRKWTIPAASGSNRADLNPVRQVQASEPAIRSANAGASNASATSEKSAAPLMLSLPETPISASGFVAIRSRGVIAVPANEAQSAENPRNLQIGQLTNLVEPIYPLDARRTHAEGIVKLHAVVAVDGRIESLEAVSGPDTLVQAAMTAVREWRYSPTLLNGKPIATQEDVSFVFRLPD